ncbi:MAG: SRPBCC domain-containing protein [Phycisphaerales bacterium]
MSSSGMVGLKVSTPTEKSIVMTREFRAPRRMVWEAMTRPELMRRWMFAPPGWEMTVCEFDARVGGRFRWQWRTAEADPAMTIHGELREVVLHERIVHTERMEMAMGGDCGGGGCEDGGVQELLATLEFSERGGVTLMRMTLEFATKEARDGALASGMEHGMEAGYKSLDEMFAKGS